MDGIQWRSKNDRNASAPIVMICVNSGLYIVKKNHEFQRGNRTKVFARSARRTKNMMTNMYIGAISQTGISHEERSFTVGADTLMHVMSKSFTSRRAGYSSEIERILYDYCSEWVNHYDKRSYCPRQKFGHVESRPVMGRLFCRTLTRKIMVSKWVFVCMEGRTIARIDQQWQTHQSPDNCVPSVVLGVLVDSSPRSDAEAASGDRTPPASGHAEPSFPDWRHRQCW